MTLLSSGNYLDGRTFDTNPRFNRGEGGNKTRIAKVFFFFKKNSSNFIHHRVNYPEFILDFHLLFLSSHRSDRQWIGIDHLFPFDEFFIDRSSSTTTTTATSTNFTHEMKSRRPRIYTKEWVITIGTIGSSN